MDPFFSSFSPPPNDSTVGILSFLPSLLYRLCGLYPFFFHDLPFFLSTFRVPDGFSGDFPGTEGGPFPSFPLARYIFPFGDFLPRDFFSSLVSPPFSWSSVAGLCFFFFFPSLFQSAPRGQSLFSFPCRTTALTNVVSDTPPPFPPGVCLFPPSFYRNGSNPPASGLGPRFLSRAPLRVPMAPWALEKYCFLSVSIYCPPEADLFLSLDGSRFWLVHPSISLKTPSPNRPPFFPRAFPPFFFFLGKLFIPPFLFLTLLGAGGS